MAKKKLRLKYRLEPTKKWVGGVEYASLSFQVLYMDEVFRAPKKGSCEFLASNGVSIMSYDSPNINLFEDAVYLRGHDRASDNYVQANFALSVAERDALIKKIHFALKEWSVEWFKGKK